MKKILSILLAGLLMLSLAACGDEKENESESKENETVAQDYIEDEAKTGKFEYDLNEMGDYEITSYTPASAKQVDLILPSEVNGRDIVGIAANVFQASTTIKSVTIPATYQYIGDAAFADCDLITSITLPASMEAIGKNTFDGCDNLQSIALSAKITEIPEYAFNGCKSLTAINLSYVTSIENGAFSNCASLATVVISDKLEYATKMAFYGCDKLIYHKDGGLLYLGTDANKTLFLVGPESVNIKSCAVSATTKVIADNAFINCDYLTKVTLSDSVKKVKGTAFTVCDTIEYTASENGLYLGTAENPYMILVKLEMPLVEDFSVHKDTKIITNTAFAQADILEDIGFSGTQAEWNAIIKDAEWEHDLDINVTCSDGLIEKETI